jgi:uncharacterized protein YbjT (DUF2867 family)
MDSLCDAGFTHLHDLRDRFPPAGPRDRLHRQDRPPVRAGSRSADIPFDWEDRETWAPAVAGTRAIYVSYYPDLAIPGSADDVGELARLALAAGVRRIVLLSGRGEEEAKRAEERLQASGADWTIVRCSWFSQNFSESFFHDLLMTGEVVLPVEDVPEPFIDLEDVADIAAEALIGAGHGGRLYDVTGPRLLTFADALAEISAASGRPLRLVRVSLDEFRAGMEEAGVPDALVALLEYLFGEVLDGRNAHTTGGVREALGREPRDFRDYARRTAAEGTWAVAR